MKIGEPLDPRSNQYPVATGWLKARRPFSST